MFDHEQLQLVETARGLVKDRLLAARRPDKCWEGRLSSSAVSTAVAALAMSLSPGDADRQAAAVNWLVTNMNADGGWGDTPQSPSNLSAVMLARAALVNSASEDPRVAAALTRSADWLYLDLSNCDGNGPVAKILQFYGKDLTFSAPILTVCLLSGSLGPDMNLWKFVPALPFEAALIPSGLFNLVNLPVVSYAIPALIAVGIAQTTHYSPANPILRWLRVRSIKPALRKLRRLVPASGGFLEAAPLTGFVAFCLGRSGFSENVVVQKGLQFLRDTRRDDGSWPIDTNLAGWLTSLSARALSQNNALAAEDKSALIAYLLQAQTKSVNVFTGAQPGGWSWTDLSGGVPDADDTAAALVALAHLQSGNACAQVVAGLQWLLGLMNSDGGIPTFCRGWGYLPFDRSCPDLSAHALMAFSLWQTRVNGNLRSSLERGSSQILKYLEKSRDKDGVWAPLWFGDQDAVDQKNRVYGSAIVLEALSSLPTERVAHLTAPALNWLKQAINADGGFGGEPNTPSKIETTAKALSALAMNRVCDPVVTKTACYLAERIVAANGQPEAAPVGMYFASLWYDEKLYPLIFSLGALGAVLRQHKSQTLEVTDAA